MQLPPCFCCHSVLLCTNHPLQSIVVHDKEGRPACFVQPVVLDCSTWCALLSNAHHVPYILAALC